MEVPGEFCFPPLAALSTSGARLMLALLETSVTGAGGTYVFCDTDSMGIVASQEPVLVPCRGGPDRFDNGAPAIRALSWDDVDQIIERFDRLNPYERAGVPGSILKLEAVNFDPDSGQHRALYAYGISAKRYALFNVDREWKPQLRKASEHGLGHLLNPIDPDSEDREWIRQVWEFILLEALRGEHLTLPWFDRPAVSRFTASTPALLQPFGTLNEELPYDDQIKPFNFLLSVSVAPFGHPEGSDPERFHLIAPFEMKPSRWLEMEWTDRYSGDRFRITTGYEWWVQKLE